MNVYMKTVLILSSMMLATVLVETRDLDAAYVAAPAQPTSIAAPALLTLSFGDDGQGDYNAVSSDGAATVGWTVATGVGLVVELRLPASRLAEMHRAIRSTPLGVYPAALLDRVAR